MSRLYAMSLTVEDFDVNKRTEIEEAASEQWEFEDENWYFDKEKNTLYGAGEGSLGGGESDEEFSGRLAAAIFKANGKACKVSVNSTYLEELPYETYIFDEDELPVGYDGDSK